jgi:hypothetical protein
MVRKVVGPEKVKVVTSPTDDHRSYHISSEKIRRELGFVARRGLEGAVRDLAAAFRAGKIPNPMDDIRYYNVKTMQALNLK